MWEICSYLNRTTETYCSYQFRPGLHRLRDRDVICTILLRGILQSRPGSNYLLRERGIYSLSNATESALAHRGGPMLIADDCIALRTIVQHTTLPTESLAVSSDMDELRDQIDLVWS